MRRIGPDYIKWWMVLVVAACLAGPPAASGATLRVKAGVTNAAPDGLSWTNAFPGVVEALAVARSGDEIWVAAGTYPGGFTLGNGIALYGGFAGIEEARAQRNFIANLSRLDGARRTNVLSVANGAGAATRVDGFVIQHGLANGTGAGGSGGGLRVTNAEPVIANNQFLSNNCIVVGGAIYLLDSFATIISNYFGFNGTESTARDGGALAAVRSSPQVEANSFVGNRGRDGGAIYLASSTGFLLANSLLSNTATRDGGGVYCASASPQITHNRFLGNITPGRGGGVALLGGGATFLFNNVFARNEAGSSATEPSGGGGVFSDTTSQPNILNNTLVLNQAAVGGLLLSNRNATVAHNIIAFGSSGVGGVALARFQANDVFGNSVNYVGIPDATGSDGNVSVDPKFAGDVSLGVINILPDSPCRDVGNSAILPPGATDIDGQPRVQGSTVDLGADETDGVITYFLPKVVRVALDGNDNNDGAAWARPKKSVQAAIETAGRTGGEVWVKAGAYLENLDLRPFTSLYGGFAGAETNRVQRDWRTRETILDGQSIGRVLRALDLRFDEAVDGFTIRNGVAVAGGGIYASGNVRLANNRFEANAATPATSATQVQGGGALYLASGDSAVINNAFLRNSASSTIRVLSADGGAIKLADGRPTIANNLFRMNLATNSATSGPARGGALLVVGNAAPRVINNTFLQNAADSVTSTDALERGGAVSFEGTVTAGAPSPLLVNNLVAYNSSGIGGSGREPQIYNNLVWGSVRANYQDMADATGRNGNLSLSPGLTGPYGDPHLTADSPARDAGDDSVIQSDWLDLDGKPRIVGSAPDIGADEYDGTAYQIQPRVFYVRTDGADTNTGASWSTAKQTIGAALAEAALDGGEVWVGAGTYPERVQVSLFTYLFGGFRGNETNRDGRNWHTQPTILDGGGNPASPIAGSPIVTVLGTDAYATVDGFTIQNGAARLGAGLNVFGSPLITHNLVRSNIAISTVATTIAAGGGLYCDNGFPTIQNNLFVANLTTNTLRSTNSLGGAIYLNSASNQLPAVLHNTILNNRGGRGGGVFLGAATGARIANNIVAFGNSGLVAANATNTAIANCVFGNTINYQGIAADPGSITEDPRLVDWRAGNYRLRADSPCLDRGDASVPAGNLDFFAEPRLVGATPDIGADEFFGPATADFSLALAQPLSGSVYVAPATVFLSPSITGGNTTPAYLEYLANDGLVGVSTASPFSTFAPDLIVGEYTLLARAITAGGAMATSAPVAISVVLPPGNVPPTVRFTAPTNGQEYVSPANVRVSFNWSKSNGRVVRWQLLTNGVLAASNPNVPIGTNSATLTIPNLQTADYQLTAIVHDNVGTSGTNNVSFVVGRANPVASVPQPPVLQTNGTVLIEFSAPTADADYVLERTLDLTRWTPVSTNHGGTPIQLVVPVNLQIPLEAFRTKAYYP